MRMMRALCMLGRFCSLWRFTDRFSISLVYWRVLRAYSLEEKRRFLFGLLGVRLGWLLGCFGVGMLLWQRTCKW